MLQDENLQASLPRSRLIGQASGVLIERHTLTPGEALARLSRASQRTKRKSDIAYELIQTGAAPTVDEPDDRP